MAAAKHSNFISFCKSLRAVDVSQYTEQLSIVTSQTEVLPKGILMSLKCSPGASTEARQQLDIQFCTHALQIQIANGRSSTTAWVKKVCLVLLGNHYASATQPVRFFWQSHRLIMHMQTVMMVHQPLLVCYRPAQQEMYTTDISLETTSFRQSNLAPQTFEQLHHNAHRLPLTAQGLYLLMITQQCVLKWCLSIFVCCINVSSMRQKYSDNLYTKMHSSLISMKITEGT